MGLVTGACFAEMGSDEWLREIVVRDAGFDDTPIGRLAADVPADMPLALAA